MTILGKELEVHKMNAKRMTPELDPFAAQLLADRDNPTMQYLYEAMYGEPMPKKPPTRPSNVVQFPKRIPPERRKVILRAAWGRDDG
jgi:hypothetical protein